MREIYYMMLKEFSLNDTLSNIPELPFTKKIKMLRILLENNKPESINMALIDYQINYINLKRVDLKIIMNVLKGLCNKYKKKDIVK